MAQVTLPYTLTAGTPENVNNLVANLNALRDGVNTIDTAQIANGAVTAAKLASGAATPADGSISTAKIADGAVTAAKFDTTTASLLGVTTGTTTRRTSVTTNTEVSRATADYTDVSGASITINIPSGGLVLVGYSCEIKSGSADFPQVGPRMVVGSFTTPASPANASTSYVGSAATFTLSASVTGTGNQTIKLQTAGSTFNCCGSITHYTGYSKNHYIFAITYAL